MKKTVIRNNLFLLLGFFLLFFVLFIYILYVYDKNQQKEYMQYLINDVKQSYEIYDGTLEAFILDYQDDQRRITILNTHGYVLADTHDEQIGTDKSGRPEIKDIGTVYRRNSTTINRDLLYMATTLEDGNILRVSISLAPIVTMYERVMWMFSIGGIILFSIYYLGLIRINKNLLNPWLQVKKGMIALNQGKYQMMSLTSPYEEINQIMHEMNQINIETSKQLHQITSYQLQLDKILNEMKQGVILINYEGEIIYYNSDAQKVFDLSEQFMQKPCYQIIRNHQINEAIESANSDKESSHFDVLVKNRTIDCRIFPLDYKYQTKTNASVLMIFRDVSQERLIEQMKKDFFSHASHELKSPLTAIKGHAELMLHDIVKGKDFKNSTQQIIKQTEMMSLLVEDMLMLSRLEHLKEVPQESYDLNDVINEVIHQLKPYAAQKQIDLKVEIEKVSMICDLLDMQKLFKNIIENAIKYSEVDKEVFIHLHQKDHQITFMVIDQGIGIGAEHQQRVFERFYRVDKGRIDGGTGLGLAIVKHIVMKYHGDLTLTSNIGKGTTIKVLFDKNQK